MCPEFYDALKHYSNDILGTKTFPSLPLDLVKKWESKKDHIEWGGDRILPQRKKTPVEPSNEDFSEIEEAENISAQDEASINDFQSVELEADIIEGE